MKNNSDKHLYCVFQKFVLVHFIERNQDHIDSMMHEYSPSVNIDNKAVTMVRPTGDRLLLIIGPMGGGDPE